MGLNDEEEVVYNIKYVTVNGAKEVKVSDNTGGCVL